MPSNSSKSPDAQAMRQLSRRTRTTYALLVVVVIMALASAAMLWGTLEQTRTLARPVQRSASWQATSLHTELTRVGWLAQELRQGEVPRQALQTRLDVLYSLLDDTGTAPRFDDPLESVSPGTVAFKRTVQEQLAQWTALLQQTPTDAAPTEAAAKIAHAVAPLIEQARDIATAVRLDNNRLAEEARSDLHQQFLLLSGVLAGLIAGTAVLMVQLIQYARSASRRSRTMAELNQQLEARVVQRTRQIDEHRALLDFILNASPSDVLLTEVESGTVHFINHGLLQRLGLDKAPTRLFLQNLLHDPALGAELVTQLDLYGEVEDMQAEVGTLRPTWCSLSARLIEVEGQLAHLLWSFDISTHKHLEGQLRELATTDPLTGVDNRRAFFDQAGQLYEHCARHRQDCSVLMADIDFFKRINDQHGHAMGDEALRAAAQVLRATLREGDVLGRLGGEEFAALLPHTGADAALATAQRLRAAVEALHLPLPGGAVLRFTLSVGVATQAPAHGGLDALVAQSDVALYQAKAAGRNRALAHTAYHATPPVSSRSPHSHDTEAPDRR